MTIDHGNVNFSYEIAGAELPDATTVNLYWSDDDQFDAGDSPALASPIMVASGTVVGTYNESVVAGSLRPPPQGTTRLLVVVDGVIGESDETNNTLAYRPTIGVVTHGQLFTTVMPPWVEVMANSFCANGPGQIVAPGARACLNATTGYDVVMAFDWAVSTLLPVPGLAGLESTRMALGIENLVESYFGDRRFPVDIHLIGHSRGSVVIAQAAGYIDAPNRSISVTFLDPHPAHNNHIPPRYSVIPTSLGWLAEYFVTYFQGIVNEPEALVPFNVPTTAYFQETPWFSPTASLTLYERIINLWGDLPPGVLGKDLTGVVGHGGVVDEYQRIVPSIVAATSSVTPPRAAASALRTASAPIERAQAGAVPSSDLELLYPAVVDNRDLAELIVSKVEAAQAAYESGLLAIAALILQDLAGQVNSSDSVNAEGKAVLGSMAESVSVQLAAASEGDPETMFFPELGTMYIVGSHEGDSVSVRRDPRKKDLLVAKINGESIRTPGATPSIADVQRIVVEGRDGSDHINLAPLRNFAGEVIVRGGAGNDHIIGSKGNDILIGGEGRDILIGGLGDDLIIGGLDADHLLGNSGQDLLIGGTTVHDGNDAALTAILKEWTSNRNYETRIANISGENPADDRLNENAYLNAGTVGGDEAEDLLLGGSGLDWFFADDLDKVLSKKGSERIG